MRADREQLHHFFMLDPNLDCPAVQVGRQHMSGDPANGEGFSALVKLVDIDIVDLENVSVEELSRLSQEGMEILPQTELLSSVVD